MARAVDWGVLRLARGWGLALLLVLGCSAKDDHETADIEADTEQEAGAPSLSAGHQRKLSAAGGCSVAVAGASMRLNWLAWAGLAAMVARRRRVGRVLRLLGGGAVALSSGCSPRADAETVEPTAQAIGTPPMPEPSLTWGARQTLTSGSASLAGFGESLALSGDTLLVGSRGAVCVFVRQGGSWQEQERWVGNPSDCLGFGPTFGEHVALSGNTALVSCAGRHDRGIDLEGSVYVFVRSGATWSQQQELRSADATSGFGSALALEGDTAVIGAPMDAGNGVSRGAVYAFAKVSGSWTQQAKLFSPDPPLGPWGGLGESVALSGDTLLASGLGTYASVRTESGWALPVKVTDSAGGVHLRGDRALVATPGRGALDHFDPMFGRTWMFVRSGGVWSSVDLWSPVQGPNFHSGVSMSGSGDLMALSGDHFKVDGALGATLYAASDSGLSLLQGLTVAGNDDTDRVVAIDGSTLAVGASGSVVVYEAYLEHEGACDDDSECLSQHCVEGVCCDTACDGVCRSCLASRKGYGRDGLCEWIPVEAKQRCSDAPPHCDSQEYRTGILVTEMQCAYARGCDHKARQDCAFDCKVEPVGGEWKSFCIDACRNKQDCIDAQVDDYLPWRQCVNGACEHGVQGAGCDSVVPCPSPLACVDEVCCDTPCDAPCMACTQKLTGEPDGTCAAILAGMAGPLEECPDGGPGGNDGAGGDGDIGGAAGSASADGGAAGSHAGTVSSSGEGGTSGAASNAPESSPADEAQAGAPSSNAPESSPTDEARAGAPSSNAPESSPADEARAGAPSSASPIPSHAKKPLSASGGCSLHALDSSAREHGLALGALGVVALWRRRLTLRRARARLRDGASTAK
jgi:hypothetical protein